MHIPTQRAPADEGILGDLRGNERQKTCFFGPDRTAHSQQPGSVLSRSVFGPTSSQRGLKEHFFLRERERRSECSLTASQDPRHVRTIGLNTRASDESTNNGSTKLCVSALKEDRDIVLLGKVRGVRQFWGRPKHANGRHTPGFHLPRGKRTGRTEHAQESRGEHRTLLLLFAEVWVWPSSVKS